MSLVSKFPMNNKQHATGITAITCWIIYISLIFLGFAGLSYLYFCHYNELLILLVAATVSMSFLVVLDLLAFYKLVSGKFSILTKARELFFSKPIEWFKKVLPIILLAIGVFWAAFRLFVPMQLIEGFIPYVVPICIVLNLLVFIQVSKGKKA